MELQLGKYRHYKGKEYEVIEFATHSETLEKMVVYKALYQSAPDNIWVRPLEMFFENVVIEGEETPRFKYLGE